MHQPKTLAYTLSITSWVSTWDNLLGYFFLLLILVAAGRVTHVLVYAIILYHIIDRVRLLCRCRLIPYCLYVVASIMGTFHNPQQCSLLAKDMRTYYLVWYTNIT